MRLGKNIAAAVVVLMFGVLAALPFYRSRSTPEETTASPAESPSGELVLRHRAVPLSVSPESGASPAVGLEETTPDRAGPTTPPTIRQESPLGRDDPIPQLPPSYTGALQQRRHRIVDGDTLDDLARTYLGSAERRLEIFEANRDVLPSPNLLPIGVEIVIPARSRSGNAGADPH